MIPNMVAFQTTKFVAWNFTGSVIAREYGSTLQENTLM